MQALQNFRINVRETMSAQGMTQRQLADRLGVKHPYINRILSGKQSPGLEYADAIASELGVPLSVLVAAPKKEVSAA